MTQFGYACRQLGVSIVTTSVSQAKGQVERMNGSFQNRLAIELKLNNITTIEEANKYLIETFIPNYTKKFCQPFDSYPSVFEKMEDPSKIKYILSVLSTRKFDNGSSIKFKNKYYQAHDENDELVCIMPKTECLVIQAFDSNLYVSVDEKIYALVETIPHEKTSENFDEIVEEPKKRKIYIPPMRHPWKHASYVAQQQKAHKKGIYA